MPGWQRAAITYPTMDPATSLQTAETALRLVISAVLGDQWQATPGIDVAALERKREDDRRRRRGAIVDEHLASYLEFRELKEIILKRWDDGFDPVFGHKDRTEVLLTILGDVRNVIAHSRQLLPFEVDLASGISGRLRNQITIYRTSRRPADEHYPVIESVQDQYGQWGGDWVQTDIATTRLRLDVGDTVTFVCQGSDQQGRALEWLLGFDTVNSAHDAKTSPPLASATESP